MFYTKQIQFSLIKANPIINFKNLLFVFKSFVLFCFNGQFVCFLRPWLLNCSPIDEIVFFTTDL